MRTKTWFLFLLFLVFYLSIFIYIFYNFPLFSSGEMLMSSNSFIKQNSVVKTQVAIPCPETNDSVQTRFNKRLEQVHKTCEQHNSFLKHNLEIFLNNKSSLRNYHLIGHHPSRAMTCLVFKAGSSSWNEFFWKLRIPEEKQKTGFWEKAIHGNRKAFLEQDTEIIKKLWLDKNGIRIVTARHPMTRLLSGYLDKFNKAFFHNTLFHNYPLLRKYPNKYGRWNGKGYFMEWKDFASYVADYGWDFSKNLEAHFQPIAAVCDPCVIPFNFIVKLETFGEDTCWLIDKKFKSKHAGLSKQNKRKTTTDHQSLVVKHYSMLEPNVVKRILEIYDIDMKMFGYTFNLNTFEIGG